VCTRLGRLWGKSRRGGVLGEGAVHSGFEGGEGECCGGQGWHFVMVWEKGAVKESEGWGR
jgi:hypothetical protein